VEHRRQRVQHPRVQSLQAPALASSVPVLASLVPVRLASLALERLASLALERLASLVQEPLASLGLERPAHRPALQLDHPQDRQDPNSWARRRGSHLALRLAHRRDPDPVLNWDPALERPALPLHFV
jgi:hypothetical protein